MRKIKTLLTVLALALCVLNQTAFAQDDVTVVLNGEILSFDVPAQIIEGRTMVPMRKIFEELGMSVDWNADTQTVMAYSLGLIIELPINDTAISCNTIEQYIDVPAQIIGDRTLVPVRVVSELSGADVSWDAATKTVNIKSDDSIKYLDWNDNYNFYGENDGKKANGYGAIYKKSDNSIAQIGFYENSKIVKGTNYYSENEYFSGTFQNGEMCNGTYQYANGNKYVGDFKAYAKSGTGTLFYTNGNFLKGKWENDIPNGYCIFYDADVNIQVQGTYVNGKRDGDFFVNDFVEGTTYYITYKDGKLYDEKYEQQQNQQKYDEEYNALIEWGNKKVQEIEEEADKIYNETIEAEKRKYFPNYDKVTEAFSITNMQRQINAMMPTFKQTAELKSLEYKANALENLTAFLQEQMAELKQKYNIKD